MDKSSLQTCSLAPVVAADVVESTYSQKPYESSQSQPATPRKPYDIASSPDSNRIAVYETTPSNATSHGYAKGQPHLSPGGHNLSPPHLVSAQPVNRSMDSYAWYHQGLPDIQLPDYQGQSKDPIANERYASHLTPLTPPASRTSSGKAKPKSTFKCEFEGCTSNPLFVRLADLQRHHTTVHGGDKPFPCIVHRCGWVGSCGFNKRDQLTEHLRSYHHLNDPSLVGDQEESEGAIETDIEEDDDDDESDDNAIEDEDTEDDDDQWEDDDNSGPFSVTDKELFRRVDSSANLRPRRSLLTTLMHEGNRAKARQNAASPSTPALRQSRTSSPNGSSLATSPHKEPGLIIRASQIPQSKPIIITASNTQPPVLSPRTNRRNIIQTELTESLRKHLLWERQQKNATNNAILKQQQSAISSGGRRYQAEIPHRDVSLRSKSDIAFSKSAPFKSPHAAGSSNGQVPGLVRGGGSEREKNAVEPKELVLLLKPNKRDVLESSVAIHSSPIPSPESISDSSVGKPEDDEDHSLDEVASERNTASEDHDISVKSTLDTAMNVLKNLLLRQLLDYALAEATDAPEGSNSSMARGASSSASPSLSLLISNSQTPQRNKRLRDNGRDPDDGNGDGDDSDSGDRPRKKSGKGPPDRLPRRRLKCPFHQRQPEKFRKAACRGEGFTDMAKLKDHIKRVHTQPPRCSRCWLEMESEEAYSEHLRQEDICKKKAEPQDDRIRPQLLKRLDFKKAPYANARNVEDKWRMLFSVLFPGHTNMPSPYEQQGMSPQLERALSEALEEELTRELALIEPIMTKIKGCIPAIIESCRQKLMSPSSSSDDEAVSTTFGTPSCRASSDSEPGSSTKQAGSFESPTTSRYSGSSVEVVHMAEALSHKAQGKRPQHLVASDSDVSMNCRQEASAPGSSAGYSMFHPAVSQSAYDRDEDTIGISFDEFFTTEHEPEPFAFPGNISREPDPVTESSSASWRKPSGLAYGPYNFVKMLPQQDVPYLSDFQFSPWPLPRYRSGGANTTHGAPEGDQESGTFCQESLPVMELDWSDLD